VGDQQVSAAHADADFTAINDFAVVGRGLNEKLTTAD
jgi:hypothetical protein